MNRFFFLGRLTKDPEIRHNGETTVAKFTLAVNRRRDRETADFFTLTAFGKLAEFAEKYLAKGVKVIAEGRVENNNYTNRDGQKVYSFAWLAESIEFAESKNASRQSQSGDFVPVPDDVDDGDLPFN